MNQTKKLTTGAMLLAIVGALMAIDRQFVFAFSEFIILAMPIIIILYSTKYKLTDGAIISVGLLILSFIVGNIANYIFTPIAIFVGLVYSFGVKKDLNRRKLFIITAAIYILGEVLVSVIISPLLGIDLISEMYSLMNQVNEMTNGYLTNNLGSAFDSTIKLSIVFSFILLGIMEAWLVQTITAILFKRFKIKEIIVTSPLDFKIKPIVAYICFISLFGSFINIDQNSSLFYIVHSISLVGGIVLFYVGYVYIILYGKLIYNKNLTLIVILLLILIPYNILVLIIIGFLYGAGPLERYLYKMKGINSEDYK